jgi:hypothetical protein
MRPGNYRFPRTLGVVRLLTVLSVSVATTYYAFFVMFGWFSPYDDEGYLLISLKGYLSGASIYDQVFTQYGPLFLTLWGGVFRLIGLEVTHEASRLITLVVWSAATLVAGLIILRATKSLTLSIGAQLLTFLTLWSLVNEPMHPGGLLALLLLGCIAVAVLIVPRHPAGGMLSIGVLATGAALVKINVGALALLASAWALGFGALADRSRWVRTTLTVVLVGAPFLLIARDLDQFWALKYAILVATSALSVVVAASRTDARSPTNIRPMMWFVAGGLITVLVLALLVLASGTSVAGLVRGALLSPLTQPDAFSLPLFTPDWILLWAGTGLLLCIVATRRTTLSHVTPRRIALEGVIRIGVGLLMWITLGGLALQVSLPFTLVVPLAWIPAIPPHGGASSWDPLGRFLLAGLAVVETLQAYPVAGSQVWWSALLFVPLGAVCIWDGWNQLRGFFASRAHPLSRYLRHSVAVLVSAFLAWLLLVSLLPALAQSQRTYREATSLGLFGTGPIRLAYSQAAEYRAVTNAIRRNCETFVVLPGINSLYLFSRIRPPTWMNTTAWMYLLDAGEQRQVVAAARLHPHLCAIRNQDVLAFWSQGRPVPRLPLVKYIEQEFVATWSFGQFEILTREGVTSDS